MAKYIQSKWPYTDFKKRVKTVSDDNDIAIPRDAIVADTSGGSFTINLPASPNTGDIVSFCNTGDWNSNNLTVDRNGSNINGAASNYTADGTLNFIKFFYTGDATQGWVSSPQPTAVQKNIVYTSDTTYSLLVDDHVFADATASMTYTLPGSPNEGDTVIITDFGGNFETYNCTVARNGNFLDGASEDFDIDVSKRTVQFTFISSLVGWAIQF